MTARLAASLLVGAIVRRAEQEGGFAAVIAKGDENAGSILVLLIERGDAAIPYERLLQPNGHYAWQAGPHALDPESVTALVSRRRRSDPDLWVVELDVPSRERFAAEMNSFG